MLLSNMVICRFNFMFHHCPWSLVKLFKLASMWGNVQYKSCCYYHGNEKISFRKKKSPSCMVLSLNLIMLIILLLHFLLMSLAHFNFSRKVSRQATMSIHLKFLKMHHCFFFPPRYTEVYVSHAENFQPVKG